MFDLSKEKIDFNCPECGRKNVVGLSQVADQATINCPGCLNQITLKDNNGSTRKGISDINNAFKGLDNALKKLRR
jgi:transcription elongation factor Elf1